MRFTRAQVVIALLLAALVAAAVGALLDRREPRSVRAAAPVAERLCAPGLSREERVEAAKEAARDGTLKLALERDACDPAARSAGLEQLAFVFDRDCAQDSCLDALLKAPGDPAAAELAAAHAPQVVGALAVRACDLPGAAAERLLRPLVGPGAPALAAAARGRLLDTDRETLRVLLERHDAGAARLLQALLRGQLCEGDQGGQRRELAGALLEAMGVSVSDPVDLPQALGRVACGPLAELVPRLRLDAWPRLAEAAPALVACPALPRSLRARALAFAPEAPAPEEIVRPARAFRLVDRKGKAAVALPGEALAPAAALLRGGALRGAAWLEGSQAPVCGLPALLLLDDRGRPRVRLDAASLKLLDARGRVRARLGLQAAELLDPGGELVLRVPAGADRGVSLLDAAGRERARASWRAEGVQLKLLDGAQPLAVLVVDGRGAQLQLGVGGPVLEGLGDKDACASVAAPAGAKARFVLDGPGGRAPAVASAPVPFAPVDFADDADGEAVETADTAALKLLPAGARRPRPPEPAPAAQEGK